MKAALLYEPKKIKVEEIPEPEIKNSDDVLVRVKSVGICGSDVHYYVDGTIGGTVMDEPFIIGHEPAGIVAEVGSEVESLKPGDKVAIDPAIHCGECEHCIEGNPNICHNIRFFGTPPQQGAFREMLVHPEHLLFKLPPEVSTDEGAILEVYGVAVHSVDLVRLKPGYDVAVIGGGPVGLAVAQIAKLSGALRVFLSEPIAERREMAEKLGVDFAVNPDESDPVEAIMDLTNGRGVDIVFEAAGVSETPHQSAEMCKNGGILALIGIPSDDKIRFRASTTRRKGLTIRMIRRMKHVYPRAINLTASGKIKPEAMITHKFPLEKISDAFDIVHERKDGVVKAIIEILVDKEVKRQ